MENFLIASSISASFRTGGFALNFASDKVRVYLIQLTFLPWLGGENLIGVSEISSKTGLWSEDNSHMLVILICWGMRCSAMSKTSGLNIGEEGKNVGVTGAEI